MPDRTKPGKKTKSTTADLKEQRKFLSYQNLFIFGLFLIFLLGAETVGNAAPLKKNKAIVTGKVLGIGKICSELITTKKEQPIQKKNECDEKVYFEIRILVESIEGDAIGKNFFERYNGLILTVYSQESIKQDILNKNTKIEVSAVGDENGHLVWLKGDVVLLSE